MQLWIFYVTFSNQKEPLRALFGFGILCELELAAHAASASSTETAARAILTDLAETVDAVDGLAGSRLKRNRSLLAALCADCRELRSVSKPTTLRAVTVTPAVVESAASC